MLTISLLEIAFFVFWLWTLMELINQRGMDDTRKTRLITFHTFLGLIGIAFYFFLMISAFISEGIFRCAHIAGASINIINTRIQPALIVALIIILIFPFVAALNLIVKAKYKHNYKAKIILLIINAVEGTAIAFIFGYIMLAYSWMRDFNRKSESMFTGDDVARFKTHIFGITFGLDSISPTFEFVFVLFCVTIVIWVLATLHYLFFIKLDIKRKEEVILNTEEIKNITEYVKIYNNSLAFLIGFAVLLLRNLWDWCLGFRISGFLLKISSWIAGVEVEKLRSLIGVKEGLSGFREKIGGFFFKMFDAFFAGNVGDVFSAGYVIAYVLIIFAIIVWLLIRHINRDLLEIQETHEVKMNGLKHAIYVSSFDPWKISLFVALMAIGLLIYFYKWPYYNAFLFIKEGIVVTFEVTVGAMALALLLGLLAGLGKLSSNSLFKGISSIYVEVVRGIPLLVQLFYIYYGLGALLNLPALPAAIAAIAICYGAYLAETFRAGIQSISQGQREAAKSLGMTNYQMMRHVIVPQGFKVILPPIGNDFIAMLKDSSLVSIVGVADIMRRGREFVAVYFTAFETYTIDALLYLVITLILSKVVWNMEKIMATDKK